MSRSLSGRVPTRAEHFLLERLEDEFLLYHPQISKAIRLNETAALVWDLSDGTRSADDIATLLVDAFPEEAERVRNDVEAVFTRLSAEGVLYFLPAR